MDKRLEKRHKRQVARAQSKAKVSEPDVRTPEEIEAARIASKPDMSRGQEGKINPAGRPIRGAGGPVKTATSAARTAS